ncbi:hypothetical protein Droror1_Dr00023249 [Drosera rotundifolia]
MNSSIRHQYTKLQAKSPELFPEPRNQSATTNRHKPKSNSKHPATPRSRESPKTSSNSQTNPKIETTSIQHPFVSAHLLPLSSLSSSNAGNGFALSLSRTGWLTVKQEGLAHSDAAM